MQKCTWTLGICLTVAFCSSAAAQVGMDCHETNVRCVSPDGKGEYASIQAAIDAAVPGDEVVLCEGTYTGTGNGNITFSGKQVTIRSVNPFDNAVRDATIVSGNAPVFELGSGDDNVLLWGITITGSSASVNGAGLHCTGGSPTIRNCVFTGCVGSNGGAIALEPPDQINPFVGTPKFENCIIKNNESAGGFGGAIYIREANALISGCTISGNSISSQFLRSGGGIHCIGSSPTIRHSIISDNDIFNNTITSQGGGLALISGGATSAPTIERCVIDGNYAASGGGIYVIESPNQSLNPSVRESRIVRNRGKLGGGMFLAGGHTVVRDTLIANNIACGETCTKGAGASGAGGALFAIGATAEFVGCTIAENWAYLQGGGSYITGGPAFPVAFRNTILWGNQTNCGNGPQISLDDVNFGFDGAVILEKVVLQGGTGAIDDDGGTITLEGGAPVVITTNPTFVASAGAALASDGLACTIVQLETANPDYHISSMSSPARDAGNDGLVEPPPQFDFEFDPRIVGIRVDIGADELNDCNGNGIADVCDIDCGAMGGPCDVPGCGASDDCNGNGILDECDVDCSDPDGNGMTSGSVNNVLYECLPDCDGDGWPDLCDLTQCASIPCHCSENCTAPPPVGTDCNSDGTTDKCQAGDANDNGLNDICDIFLPNPPLGPSEDLNGNNVADDGEVVYVDQAATGLNDGTSWTDAYTDLQSALDHPLTCGYKEIWVAQGTYVPTVLTDDDPPDVRSATFQLESGVEIYGGFLGTQDPVNGFETLRGQRDFAVNVTTLSGVITGDNVYHVVTGSGTDDTAILDGFTITGGLATGSAPHHRGGGVFIDVSGDPVIRNCTITFNQANEGGGMFTNGSFAVVSGPACFFDQNVALTGSGGGMMNLGSAVDVAGCRFTANVAAASGGGVFNDGLATGNVVSEFRDCLFSDNQANTVSSGEGGGGLYLAGVNIDTARITECTFENNVARNGGGVYTVQSDVWFTSCEFFGNTLVTGASTGDGGGAFVLAGFSDDVRFINSLFARNTARVHGGGLSIQKPFFASPSSPTIVNCTFADNSTDQPDSTGGGLYLREVNATVDGSIFWANTDRSGSIQSGQIVVEPTASATVSRSCVQDDLAYVDPYPGIGNIDVHPLMFNVYRGTLAEDFRLRANSPCIDIADTNKMPADDLDLDADMDVDERLPLDLRDLERFFDDVLTPNAGVGFPPTLDMGSYEFQCTLDEDCENMCFFGTCISGFCFQSSRTYGDINGDGTVGLFDLFCVLDGFEDDFSTCAFVDVDIQPCGGNGTINLDDLYAVFDAMSDIDPCCTEGACCIEGVCAGDDFIGTQCVNNGGTFFQGVLCSANPCSQGLMGPEGSGGAMAAMTSMASPTMDVWLRAEPDSVAPGEMVTVRAFGNNFADLTGYEVGVDVSGGSQGTLDPVSVSIDTARSDFALYGLDPMTAANDKEARLMGALPGQSVSATEAKYLGTSTFKASSQAKGKFTVSLRPKAGTMAFDSNGAKFTINVISNAQVKVGS